ncbi:type VII secretion-associated serine protease mycosin [Dactylosporangium aurantiacum]|uniref:Type VII secretion-associated serine protease mycosin n=1 Tax=Dactylosporangium aurantiacum TaxID=35754 RepID=A0A9Q9MQ47_9ACTN|nr:type VII secretion-associated serine protease mycosin [Dactylosporangium aurantiacum]MDG6108555.1 type VII secretion-associated serine protease mycosin [Dactylosporangium aurantiacum]UWZ57222.1 type VII secretion-associated serine protease mycosin [Dactylosporangium aurantiacum]
MRHIRRIGAQAVAGALAAGVLAAVPGVATPAAAAPSACGPSFTDKLTDTPWPLTRLHPELAWPMTKGDGVIVAVIDSGVATTHPSLKDQVLPGKDFVQANGVGDCDQVAHGTFVAGIIAGLRLPGAGFYGVAPGAKILPIRVMEDDQKSFDQNLPNTIATAIDYAVDHGAGVINLSLVTQPTPKLAASVSRALSQNVVVVAAAGNDGASQNPNQPAYPAAYDGVLAVAGVDEQDKHVSTSTSGDYVDVAAPGVRIQGPAPQGGGFGLRSGGGTSFAAPYVAGTAALLRAYYPDLTPQQIADRITSTADHPPSGRNPQVGFGTVNPYRAVAALTGTEAAAVPVPATAGLGLDTGGAQEESRLPAIWTAFGAVVVAALIWAGLLVRRVRRGQRGEPVVPAPRSESRQPSRDRFEPTVGPMNVRAPTVHRTSASRGLANASRSLSMPTSSAGGSGSR